MTSKPYLNMIRRHFAFLNEQYGFTGPSHSFDENDPSVYILSSLIEYSTHTTIVEILHDRDDSLGVSVGPVSAKTALVNWVAEFFSRGKDKIIISPFVPATNPDWAHSEYMEAYRAYWAGEDITQSFKETLIRELQREAAWEEYRLSVYATALRQYCDPFLRGDFSKWSELRVYIRQSIRADYRALTGRDLDINQ